MADDIDQDHCDPEHFRDPKLWEPEGTHWLVKICRFLNILEDNRNILSPTKFNVWGANAGAVAAAIITVLGWFYDHMGGIELLWSGVGAWLVQGHATNHFNKKRKDQTELKKTQIEQK